jgi:hypothetical protein
MGRGREEAERPDGCCSDVRKMLLDRDKLLDWPGAMQPRGTQSRSHRGSLRKTLSFKWYRGPEAALVRRWES